MRSEQNMIGIDKPMTKVNLASQIGCWLVVTILELFIYLSTFALFEILTSKERFGMPITPLAVGTRFGIACTMVIFGVACLWVKMRLSPIGKRPDSEGQSVPDVRIRLFVRSMNSVFYFSGLSFLIWGLVSTIRLGIQH